MKFKLALVQTNCFLGDENQNLEKARGFVTEAVSRGAQLVIFPEMYLTGYALKEETAKHALLPDSPFLSEVRALATGNNVTIIMGYPEMDQGSGLVYNSVYFTDRSGKSKVQRKIHLVRGETGIFEAGKNLQTFDTPLLKIGIMICYDLYFPEVARILALKDVDIIVVPSADWYPFDRLVEKLIPARAIENSVYVAYCNRVGTEDKFHFFGRSCIVDPRGNILREASDQNEVIVGEIDSVLAKQVREDMGFLRDRRPQMYGAA